MNSTSQALAQAVELHGRGELARAEQMYREVLAREPRNARALNYLGALVLQRGRIAEAVPLLEQSVAIDASAEHLSNLGAAYHAAGRCEEALSVAERVVQIAPKAGAYYLRALALRGLGCLEEAANDYRRAIELDRNHAWALNNLADIERALGRLEASLAHLDAALAIDPDFATAHYNRALVLLAVGNLAEGFAEYEWRLRCAAFAKSQPAFAQPTWDGLPLAHQTLLLHAEQGLGDTLQWVRYIPLVLARATRYHLAMPGALVPLLEQSGFRNLAAQEGPLPGFDVHVPLGSLPRLFGTTLETIPATTPYLQADARRVERWRAELAGYDGWKVGIVWQGSPTYAEDAYRSIPLARFAPLAEVPGVRLVSLQKGPGIEQLGALQNAMGIVDLGSRIDNEGGAFLDTAAVMKDLDLVITSDTACAHLAGALGVPVWVALGLSPDWRWLRGRDDSPWYPTARLFRQSTFGDWAGVFASIRAQLSKLVSRRRN